VLTGEVPAPLAARALISELGRLFARKAVTAIGRAVALSLLASSNYVIRDGFGRYLSCTAIPKCRPLSLSHDESFTAAYLMPPTLLPAPVLMSFEED
jgi:hypothetical protein